MARYPGTLESANTNEFGIVFADQIQGHKTVPNLESLYNISEAILSKSKTNSGNDAIGQEWFVVSENCYYRLDNWENRKEDSGWVKSTNSNTELEESISSFGIDRIKNFTTTNNNVSLNYKTWENPDTITENSITLLPATEESAGVMTSDDKIKIDKTIPGYTINSYKISENPILSGNNIYLTGYDNNIEEEENTPNENDTINSGISKLNKSLNSIKDNLDWFEGD